MINSEVTTNDDIDFLKKQVSRLTSLLKDKDDKIKILTSQVMEASNDSKVSMKKISIDSFKPTDSNKEIVKLYAYGYSPSLIYTTLNEKLGKDVQLVDIEQLIYDIQHNPLTVELSLMDYYNECQEVFEKNKITKSLFANTILAQINELDASLGRIALVAREANDYREERQILQAQMALQKEKASIFSKNVLNIFETKKGSKSSYDEEYKALKDQYDDTNSSKKIIKIKKTI